MNCFFSLNFQFLYINKIRFSNNHIIILYKTSSIFSLQKLNRACSLNGTDPALKKEIIHQISTVF